MLLHFSKLLKAYGPLLADTNKAVRFNPCGISYQKLFLKLGEEMADGFFRCQIMLMAWCCFWLWMMSVVVLMRNHELVA